MTGGADKQAWRGVNGSEASWGGGWWLALTAA